MMERLKSTRILVISALLTLIILQIAAGSSALPNYALQTEIANPTVTPDLDRLLEPTLPAQPNQADIGAQDYWLNCMPCHGDVGQGLTDDFRQLYPPEDRGCWDSGCHGERPYENGWTLPDSVPPIIGTGILDKFENASTLFTFVHRLMPRQDPSSLDEEVYWQLVAFLLRENGFDNPHEKLNLENAKLVFLGGPPDVEETTSLATGTPVPSTMLLEDNRPFFQSSRDFYWLSLTAIALVGIYLLYHARRSKTK